MSEMPDIYCPVCGYYCLGKGGNGCIDKPALLLKKEELSAQLVEMAEQRRPEVKLKLAEGRVAELEQQLSAMRERAEKAEEQLRLLGDMAVADWNNELVGKVDAVQSREVPETYRERISSLYALATKAEEYKQRAESAEQRIREAMEQQAELQRKNSELLRTLNLIEPQLVNSRAKEIVEAAIKNAGPA